MKAIFFLVLIFLSSTVFSQTELQNYRSKKMCAEIREFSQSFMTSRQENEDKAEIEKSLQAFPFFNQENKNMVIEILYLAYQTPILLEVSLKNKVITEFGDQQYQSCIKKGDIWS